VREATDLQYWETRFIDWWRAHPSDDGSHDLAHFRRVWQTAHQLSQTVTEEVNALVLLAAAYFHDLVNLPKNHPDRAHASTLAAKKTADILQQLGFDQALIPTVQHAIAAHSYSANIQPETIEAKLIQDADRVEALGAIGLARVFYISGQIGSQLFDADDPLAEQRERDDKRFALDHFEEKLLRLPDSMQTEPGRQLAEERAQVLRDFRRQLCIELAVIPSHN